MIKSIIALVICFSFVAAHSQEAKKETNFPTADEIDLVLSQAERAFQQYDRSIKLEAGLPSMQIDSSTLDKDRQVVATAGKLIVALKKNPDGFHGLGGFLLLGVLDDASRNAALCFGSVFADVSKGLLSEKGLDRGKAYELMQIGQACQDVSVQLYTISENLHALMIRELEGQQILSDKAVDALNQCAAMLKGKKQPTEH